MFNYLTILFGKNNVERFDISIEELPIYMHSYTYEYIKLYGRKLVFMKPYDIDINAYVNHSKLIYEKFQLTTVLVIEKSKEVQRKNLILNNLMFIEKEKYIFLPFIGIIFNECKEKLEEDIDELTYKDFIVSLAFIYSKNKILKVQDLCMFANTNKMTVIRTTNKLEALKLINKTKSNKAFCYQLKVSKKDYLNTILKLMKSPVYETRLIDKKHLPINAVLSSLSAISRNAMINDDDIKTYAISKEEYSKIQNLTEEYTKGLIIPNDTVKVEVWNYNPLINSKNNCAELISVIKTINENDERVLQSIEEIKEFIINE